MNSKALALSALLALAPPVLGGDVGVSIGVAQPGFYGQIDIGDYPRPRLVYAEPVYVQRGLYAYAPPPVYLHVPPGHARHWRDHCGAYGACGRPVYFVQEAWYEEVYVPRYRRHHGEHGRGHGGHGRGRGHGHGHGRGDW